MINKIQDIPMNEVLKYIDNEINICDVKKLKKLNIILGINTFKWFIVSLQNKFKYDITKLKTFDNGVMYYDYNGIKVILSIEI